MKYDITKQTAPKMPNLGKGTECIKLLLSQALKDMHEPLVPMLFPSLGAHISGAEFQYPDLTWQEPTGLMANLVADSGCNKGQLSYLVEANCRDFRLHDKGEMAKIDAWQRLPKTNDKPARPETALFFPSGRLHTGGLHPERPGAGEVRRSHAVPQHARGGNG